MTTYKHAISSCYLSHAHEQDLSLTLLVDERDSIVESNFDGEKSLPHSCFYEQPHNVVESNKLTCNQGVLGRTWLGASFGGEWS